MVGYIYLNTDLKTGKQYTGQHHYHKEGELDPNYHGSGVLWKKVLKKRPKELIKEEYIKTCYSQEELDESEKYYTKLFKTLYPNGYNLEEGGCGGVPCEETRRKISESNKGRVVDVETRKRISEAVRQSITEETLKKLSDSHKGLDGYWKGKNLSEETRKKLSDSHLNGKLSKKVLQFSKTGEFIREWVSLKEIERHLGYNSSHISKCCRGVLKSSYGFIWRFKEVV